MRIIGKRDGNGTKPVVLFEGAGKWRVNSSISLDILDVQFSERLREDEINYHLLDESAYKLSVESKGAVTINGSVLHTRVSIDSEKVKVHVSQIADPTGRGAVVDISGCSIDTDVRYNIIVATTNSSLVNIVGCPLDSVARKERKDLFFSRNNWVRQVDLARGALLTITTDVFGPATRIMKDKLYGKVTSQDVWIDFKFNSSVENDESNFVLTHRNVTYYELPAELENVPPEELTATNLRAMEQYCPVRGSHWMRMSCSHYSRRSSVIRITDEVSTPCDGRKCNVTTYGCLGSGACRVLPVSSVLSVVPTSLSPLRYMAPQQFFKIPYDTEDSFTTLKLEDRVREFKRIIDLSRRKEKYLKKHALVLIPLTGTQGIKTASAAEKFLKRHLSVKGIRRSVSGYLRSGLLDMSTSPFEKITMFNRLDELVTFFLEGDKKPGLKNQWHVWDSSSRSARAIKVYFSPNTLYGNGQLFPRAYGKKHMQVLYIGKSLEGRENYRNRSPRWNDRF
eukprot:TRINITY_DN86441_c0_g1_i1.p1 TRINITY_DN86441_c0_g1~~TRINITY_DN86441_c0_g1_i1.p1  ORF type:complete len:595 (-),score=34.55 TRINITY_DN86441_c0_g1_i1:101-1624(-)